MEAYIGILMFCIAGIMISSGDGKSTFSVTDFGAIGDGKTDDSSAFSKAWNALCGGEVYYSTPTLEVPKGKIFLLQPMKFEGPCKSKEIHFQVMGEVIAPKTNAWKHSSSSWLSFSNVGNLIFDGSGKIDGQGYDWWASGKQAADRPTALHFNECDNLRLSGLTHTNSPRNHISINKCNGVFISNLRIFAPRDSPSTDGIDISKSTLVDISHSYIATGDDCIAINGGSSYINITNIFCGPGHGISVGSLGRDGAKDTVEEVHVRKCVFRGTQNGARIKTWQGGLGYARKISYEHIRLIAVENPIIIDQYYCNGEHNCRNEKTAVVVSDVKYYDIRGTSADEKAITLNCSSIGCSNIVMNGIKIISSVPGQTTYAVCQNVHGTSHLTTPIVPCLSNFT